MAQHDHDIADQSGAAFRSDLNLLLDAIVSNNSGATEPTTKFAYMFWADTTANLLKMRNGANSAWITLGDLTVLNFGHASLVGGVVPIAQGGTNAAAAADAFNNLKQVASLTVTGVVELATAAEVLAGTDATRVITPATLPAGSLVQRVQTQILGTGASSSSAIPQGSVPQSNEGAEVMTRTITPENSSNILSFRITCLLTNSTAGEFMAVALFKDSDVNAIAAQGHYQNQSGSFVNVHLDFQMVAGQETEITFKVRVGQGSAGTCGLNGNAYAAATCSAIEIIEYKV